MQFPSRRRPRISRRATALSLAVSCCFAVSACMAGNPAPSDPAAVVPDRANPAPEAQPMPSQPAPPDSSQSGPQAGKAHVGEPVGAGPFGQFIVKYRDGTAPLTQQGAVQARLDQTARQAGLANKSGLKLTWKSRMGIQADVFSVSPALDRAEAVRLMQTFAADPDVQFIEPDNHITLGPIIRGPEVIDK